MRDKVNSGGTRSIHVVILIVSPLSSLIKDQIRRSNERNLKAAALIVKRKENIEDLGLDYEFAQF